MTRISDIIFGVAIGFAAALLLIARPEPRVVRVLRVPMVPSAN